MSIIKIAAEKKQESGIRGWTNRHPHLAAGAALTGGIGAADAGLSMFNAWRAKNGGIGKAGLHGLGQGLLYGGILSAVEPMILHGALRKKEEHV